MTSAPTDRAADGSEYGSDFDDDDVVGQLCKLLDDIEVRRHASAFVVEDIEEYTTTRTVAHVPTPPGSLHHFPPAPETAGVQRVAVARDVPAVEVQLDRWGASTHTLPHDDSEGKIRFETQEPVDEQSVKDTRSPLERFRTHPKKPLSVTDLVSPAWCELQYWYSLTKYGRVKRTPAMKQGSAVHKVLEEQVHQTVPVEVKTREDHWGLRIWNIIQGLRTLRATGLTRELEIFGVFDGQVINGIIDELSFTCTDPQLEAALDRVEEGQNQHRRPPPDQTTLTEFFLSGAGNTLEDGAKAAAQREKERGRRVYITDVKTRGNPSLPKGVSLRPTYMQLMLYRKLLAELASGAVDSTRIFDRYNVNAFASFSDALIAQLSSLDFNPDNDSTQNTDASSKSSNDALGELLIHNSLNALWTLMVQELRTTFPQGERSISKVLRAEFRGAHDGNIIGARTFSHHDGELRPYLEDELSWWKGEREAKGVEVEEAFKCRMCEFAEGCTWRLTKIEDALKKARASDAARNKSGV